MSRFSRPVACPGTCNASRWRLVRGWSAPPQATSTFTAGREPSTICRHTAVLPAPSHPIAVSGRLRGRTACGALASMGGSVPTVGRHCAWLRCRVTDSHLCPCFWSTTIWRPGACAVCCPGFSIIPAQFMPFVPDSRRYHPTLKPLSNLSSSASIPLMAGQTVRHRSSRASRRIRPRFPKGQHSAETVTPQSLVNKSV